MLILIHFSYLLSAVCKKIVHKIVMLEFIANPLLHPHSLCPISPLSPSQRCHVGVRVILWVPLSGILIANNAVSHSFSVHCMRRKYMHLLSNICEFIAFTMENNKFIGYA